MIYLILILTLNFSCVDQNTSETKTNISTLVNLSKSGTLKFTSGIRTIFQDSTGKYWIGSHNEGVGMFDGQTFKYFTTNDDLPDDQVRSIQEDNNGIIWFSSANGVSSYNGKNIIKHIPRSAFLAKLPIQSEWKKQKMTFGLVQVTIPGSIDMTVKNWII